MLKLKINVNLPQLLCIVISAAENGEFAGAPNVTFRKISVRKAI